MSLDIQVQPRARKGFAYVSLSQAEKDRQAQAAAEERASWLLLGGRKAPRASFWSERQAGASAGRFTCQQRFLTPGLRPTALPQSLYVLTASEAELQATLLPQMQRALELGSQRRTSVWNVSVPAPSQAPDLRGSLIGMLQLLATMLQLPTPGERQAWQALMQPGQNSEGGAGSTSASTSSADPSTEARFSWQVFTHPPEVPVRIRSRASEVPLDDCLRLDKLAVQQDRKAYLVRWSKVGYLAVQLTSSLKGIRGVKEWAHRLVTYCAYGPPPDDLGDDPVAMHLCNNPDCLHPLHLEWGNHDFNDPRSEWA